jgi:hypothetical protein
MPLTLELEDRKFAMQLKRLDQFNQFIRAMAAVIAPGNQGFETVSTIANQVYDRHRSSQARFIARAGFEKSRRTAISA